MSKPLESRTDRVAWLCVPRIDESTAGTHAVFRRLMERFGVVDNLLRVFALAPDRLPFFYDYASCTIDAEHGEITARERAILGVVVSAENRLAFGVVTYGAPLRDAADPELVEVLAVSPRLAKLSSRERALVDLAVKMTREAGDLDQRDIDRLRGVPLGDAAIFEAVELIAVLNAVNRLSNALGVFPNRSAAVRAGGDFPIG